MNSVLSGISFQKWGLELVMSDLLKRGVEIHFIPDSTSTVTISLEVRLSDPPPTEIPHTRYRSSIENVPIDEFSFEIFNRLQQELEDALAHLYEGKSLFTDVRK